MSPKEALKNFIAETGVTQKEAARMLGFTPEYINYILNDKKFPRNPEFFVSAVTFILAKLKEDKNVG